MTHRLNRKTAVLGLLAPLVLLAACNKAAAPAPAPAGERVATVNGKPLLKSEFELYVTNMTRQSGRDVTPEQKAELLDQYISMQLAAEEAEKSGADKDQKVQDQLALARVQVLVDAGLQKYLESNPVQDSELRPEYDRQVAALPREYHARTRRPPRRSRRSCRAAPISPSSRRSAPRTPPARAAVISAGSRSTAWSSRSPMPCAPCRRAS